MLIDGFNDACNNISSIYMKVGDDSMSTISFRTTVKGDLTNLSYILRKPETRGVEFNTVACYVTGDLLLIEIHIGK